MLQRLVAALLAAHLMLVPASAFASQNQLLSPTTGTVSGLQLTNNYNNALDSLNTCNSGASAPTNQLSGVPSPGNCWLNTTGIPYPWQVYDGTNWLTPFWIDATNHVTDVKIGGGTVSVASAATVDLCASSGNVAPRAYITITGTTTITSFGSTCAAGHVKFVTFTGVLTLTYDGTSLIIPGGQNVTTAPGDQAALMALGSGNWQVAFYQPATGQALLNPAIDVGDVIMTFLTSPPSSKYLFAFGQAVSRSTYATLLSNITIVQSVTSTNGSPTLTGFSDTTQIASGAVVEASYFSAPTTVVSCTSTTCTMANNATASTTGNVTIFPYGDGCGIATACGSIGTTFNLPDCRGIALVGRNNMGGTARNDNYKLTATYFGASPNALGAFGGAQSETLAQTNLPNVNFTISGITLSNGPLGFGGVSNAGACLNSSGQCSGGSSTGFLATAGAGSVPDSTFSNVGVSAQGTAASGGSGTAFPTVQPSLTANCMMRVLAKLEPIAPSSLAANDNAPDVPAIIERRRAA